MTSIVVSGIHVKDNSLLLTKSNGWWYPPGGTKKEASEDDVACLEREVREEFSGMEIKVGKFYRAVRGPSPRSGKPLEVRLYFIEVPSVLGVASDDVDEVRYILTDEFQSYNLTPLTKETVEHLKNDGFL